MRTRLMLLAFAMLAAVAVAPRPAVSAVPHYIDIPIQNRSDAWAWITVYKGDGAGIMRAGCVNPRSTGTITVDTRADVEGQIWKPYEVRAEITHANCSHPVYLTRTLGWGEGVPYYVVGAKGHYSFGHTP